MLGHFSDSNTGVDSHLVLQAVLGWVLPLDLVLDPEVEISRVPRVGLARKDTGDLVALLHGRTHRASANVIMQRA